MPTSTTVSKTWSECAELFRAADAHKPKDKRFEEWKGSQDDAYERFLTLPRRRMFLFFPTGEGKSKTSLALIASEGWDKCVVIAPLKTHDAWIADAAVLGLQVKVYTHEKFRMTGTHTPTNVPWIVDEYHKLGGHSGEGFKKWKRLSTKISAPIVGASATPNYNQPDRAFCLEVAFDDSPTFNYGDWLYKKCETEPNRFAYYPKVLGFKDYDGVIEYLQDKPWVAYIEDTAKWTAYDIVIPAHDDDLFDDYGYSYRHHRIMASDMEKRHKRVDIDFIDDSGELRPAVQAAIEDLVEDFGEEHGKWLIFCMHKTVAEAVCRTYRHDTWLITGDTKDIVPIRDAFVKAEHGWLIGTTAIAEGVDGLDKVCRFLLLLDDIVGDNAKRRQMIGRILPRGNSDDKERVVVTARFE